jgi:hypothetical protein
LGGGGGGVLWLGGRGPAVNGATFTFTVLARPKGLGNSAVLLHIGATFHGQHLQYDDLGVPTGNAFADVAYTAGKRPVPSDLTFLAALIEKSIARLTSGSSSASS